MTEAILEQISESVIALDLERTKALTEKALGDGVSPLAVLNEGLVKGLLAVGDKWQRQEYFISHVLMAARAMRAGMDLVEPRLVEERGKPIGRVVLGTVKGDIHDIGKNLVGLMLRATGFEVYDVGADVPSQKFIDKAKEVDADLIGCSLIMSVCLDAMREVVALADKEGLRPRVKVIVGGSPLSERVAAEIGADAYGGGDAMAAVQVAKKLLGKEGS